MLAAAIMPNPSHTTHHTPPITHIHTPHPSLAWHTGSFSSASWPCLLSSKGVFWCLWNSMAHLWHGRAHRWQLLSTTHTDGNTCTCTCNSGQLPLIHVYMFMYMLEITLRYMYMSNIGLHMYTWSVSTVYTSTMITSTHIWYLYAYSLVHVLLWHIGKCASTCTCAHITSLQTQVLVNLRNILYNLFWEMHCMYTYVCM